MKSALRSREMISQTLQETKMKLAQNERKENKQAVATDRKDCVSEQMEEDKAK